MNLVHSWKADAQQNPIEELAGTIQRLPTNIRWLHSQPDAICALALGERLARGPLTRRAANLLERSGHLGLAQFAAFAGSFLLLLQAWLGQSRAKRQPAMQGTIFVGIGALRETELIRNLEKQTGRPVTRLDETNVASFAGRRRVGLWRLIREWISIARIAAPELSGETRPGRLAPGECRVGFLVQAHRYAYFLSWFRAALEMRSTTSPMVFSAASLVSFAAVAAGADVSYRLHGFQRRSLVYPDFDEVVAFTRVEADHMSRRVPKARISVQEEDNRPIETQRAVVIAGCYGQRAGFDACADFIAWARQHSLPVHIRIHPLDRTGFFRRWTEAPGVEISDTRVPFETFLENVRPRFLLSWYSTALFDALRRGVVPVTVSFDDRQSLDVVFPFREISLRYPQDGARLDQFLAGDGARDEWLALMRSRVGVGPSG